MEFVNDHLLTLILFSPAILAGVMVFFPSGEVGLLRWTAFIGSLVTLGLSVLLWYGYDPQQAGFQFVERAIWYPTINSSYHVGIDGISLPMVLLTTLLTPLAILASFGIEDRVKSYMILFLLLETGMLGVFVSLDLLIFFVFYEIGLVPMYFLINQWGSEKGERKLWSGMRVSARTYASFKFMIYTMAASLGLLLAIQMIGAVSGTFDLIELQRVWTGLQGSVFGLPVTTVKAIAFWAFAIAFALKVPVWPFHTWLPDAHTEAPTAGSMILAGVLLKLGAYGFIRLILPLYPQESAIYAVALAFLAMMAIIFGALSAYGQSDFKRLVAYSSVNHMGFVVLGIAATAWVVRFGEVTSNDGIIAMNGAVLQMFNHGLSSAGMFFLVGVIYDRTHSRDLRDFGGLFPVIPVYGGILIFTSMASLGLPGLNGFVSEFLVVRGSWPVFTLFTALSMLGLFFTGAYILKGIKNTLHGRINEKWIGHLSEINARELFVIAPLMVLMLLLGIWPSWLLDVINQTVTFIFG